MHRKLTMTVVTDASGDATARSAEAITGFVQSVRYIKTDYADTVDFGITGNETAQGIWTESNVTATTRRQPRSPIHGTADGAAIAGGYDRVFLAGEQIKIVLAQGGNTKTGKFEFVIVDK